MIKKIQQLFLTFASSLMLMMPVLAPVTVHAQIDENLCKGANLDVTAGCPPGGDAERTITDLLRLVIDIFSLVVGVISVIMIIIGGLRYITSGGDSGNVTGAKNTILYAVVGLVVVALAQFIVRFVLAKTADVTN